MQQLQAIQAFPQGADAAGMVHEHGDTLLFCGAERFVACLMRHFVGKNHDSIGVLDLTDHVSFRLAEYTQFHAQFFCFFQVFFPQSVHTADKRDTHDATPFIGNESLYQDVGKKIAFCWF